jgi:hypothetical protein
MYAVSSSSRPSIDLRSCGAWLEFKECTWRLAPCRIGTGDDRGLHDRGMLREHFFDFEARDILATRDNDVLRTILDLDRAISVPDCEIS